MKSNISNIINRLNESKAVKIMNESLSLKFTSKSKSISVKDMDVLFDEGNGIEIYPKGEDTPTPWDAEITIKGSNLVLTGHAGPSGFGKCVVEVPISKANDVYEFEIMDGEATREILDKYNIEYK